jgi:hypothetical protein
MLAERLWLKPVPSGNWRARRELLFGGEWRLVMTFGRGALLWLLGVPLPIILLLALFWR